MARGRMTRRPRVRSLSRATREKIAEGAEAVAEKVDPDKDDDKSEKKSSGKRGDRIVRS
jgi:hypothetical protein